MKISEIQENSVFDYTKVRIFRKFNTRTVHSRGRDLQVTDMLIKDDSGEGKLTIWGNEAENYHENAVIEITDGWCKIYNEQKQLSTGKSGKITIVEDDPSIPE